MYRSAARLLGHFQALLGKRRILDTTHDTTHADAPVSMMTAVTFAAAGRPFRLLVRRWLLAAAAAAFVAPASTHAQDAPRTELGRETFTHLRNLVRIDTTNPPGNEWETVQYFDSVLRAAGIETLPLETAPGRGVLFARVRGSGEEKPIVLMGHMDVVGVERDKWSVDPFAATVREGYLYGRGTIDDKGMLAAELVTLLALERARRDGARLSRDVLFLALADEESSGEFGMRWLLERRPDLVRDAAFAINEGGVLRERDGKVLYAGIQTTEKVYYDVRLRARGSGGHGSVPVPDNAIAALARALARIAKHTAPMKLNATTSRFFEGLSRAWPDASMRGAMAQLDVGEPAARDSAEAIVSRNLPFKSMLRNSVSLTMIDGGIRENVIPTEATAVLNVRMLPGEDMKAFVDELERIAAEPAVEFTFEETEARLAPPSPVEGPLLQAVEGAMGELAPEAAVVPYMSTGATDSWRLRAAGVPAYGMDLFPLTEEDDLRMHGNDERVPIAALDFGSELLHRVVTALAVEPR